MYIQPRPISVYEHLAGLEDQFLDERERFPAGAKIIIRLDRDLNDGRAGTVMSVSSSRTRAVLFNGEHSGLCWQYCIAALREPHP